MAWSSVSSPTTARGEKAFRPTFGASPYHWTGWGHRASRRPHPTPGTRKHELLGLITGTGVLITVDEMQDAEPANLSELTLTHQDLIRRGFPATPSTPRSQTRPWNCVNSRITRPSVGARGRGDPGRAG